MKKRATRILLAGTLGVAGLTAGAAVAPGLVQAQSSETSTVDAASDRGSRIAEALSGLVSDGTLTQEQADEVARTVPEQAPPGGGHGPGGRGPGGRGLNGHGPGAHGPGGGRGLDTAAETLGLSVEELRAELESGRSLADVAAQQGVDQQDLIDALVTTAGEHLDEEVAEGDLTQEQAEARRAGLVERATERVEREGLPSRGDRGQRRNAPAPGGAAGSEGTD